MIWKEKGVEKDSYMCFFSPSNQFREYNYYMCSCGYFQVNSDYICESAGNRPPLFIYVISGTLSIWYEETTSVAHANELILINCEKAHRYYCTDHCEFLFFHFGGPMASTITNHLIYSNCSPVFQLSNASEIYQAICEPIMSLCYQEQTSDARLSTIIYTALCLMQDGNVTTSMPNSDCVVSNIIQNTDAYIKSHIGNTITLQELSSESGLSPYYFARLFKKLSGISPIEYVSIMKINYAKFMLRTTNASITDIADFLGYSSSASFINAFKSRKGISPNNYRQNSNDSGGDR